MENVIRDIARQYLPQRTHYYYARIKLATDPLYAGAGAALAGTREPLLDLGCGIGLLAHALRAQGFHADYRGVDIDEAKIASANAACARAKLVGVHFESRDLATGFPDHRGSVALLDIVQFLPPEAQEALLERSIASLTPDGVLVMRTGLQREGWRLRFTRAVDRLARLSRWMNVGPQRYPSRADLEQRFDRHGLRATYRRLHGRLPFENWLICASRPRGGGTASR
ncbi:MAG: class I SAM-dependent methyltransferase [Dokdonella sp.]|uniref:class I SAM-dependent methyltransferase n=1 Tax=Dokdonella sp. TaxID=2291710 RepID=UPI002C27E93F|nr:class I SAM-dependent methyltransferase [Dokdonella sp.]HOX70606.1 class I SAM-dependent methyltransferase [Dokdonella sp.]HOX71874.1 class I SAM-dependent methyltransferase [Dokdonella sp.]HPG94505.1 class I SAM-dependent methyltransferase [Dokdonella sp.]HPN78027.1 class I SAM-dependent methyltransferase [Dokdonella sp.]